MCRKVRILLLVYCFSSVAIGGAADDWTQYGHVTSRHSIAVDGPNRIDSSTLAWVTEEDPQDPEFAVEFEGGSGTVVYKGKVYAYAKYYDEYGVYTNSQIIAYDTNDGEILWTGITDKAYMESWSTPCIDTKNNTVLIGSRYNVYAFDANSGVELWSTPLVRQVVNASVCTVLDGTYGRAFITDYKPASTAEGRLYCINLDAYEAGNPYQPGEIIWSDIIGNTSGDTPSYIDGVVYVGSVTGTTNSTGTIYAYDAFDTDPNILWEVTSAEFEGFWGGVTLTKDGFLYAATYDTSTTEGENNSHLCKIDRNDGNIEWITDVERTDTVPVVVGDKIYVSGGVSGEYGSRPKVQCYQDNGGNAVRLWETNYDPSNLIGGWTCQPVYAGGKLYVGAINGISNKFSPYTDLYILDVSLTPADAGFIIDQYTGCGNSPVVMVDSIYSAGYGGMFKFKQVKSLGDINKDGSLDKLDLAEFTNFWLFDEPIGVNRADLNLDEKIDLKDFSLLAEELGSKSGLSVLE